MTPLSKIKDKKMFKIYKKNLFLNRKLASVENINVLYKTRIVKEVGGGWNVFFRSTNSSFSSRQMS